MNAIARGVLVMCLLSQLHCTTHDNGHDKQVEPAAKPELKATAEPKPQPKVTAEPKPEPKATAKPKPEPKPEPKPLPPPAHADVIVPQPGITTWKEIPGMTQVSGFHPFVVGVLAECDDGWCKLFDDGRLETTDVDVGDDPIWGIWRHDAWRVEFDTREEEDLTEDARSAFSLYELVEVKRWRKNRFKTVKRLETEVDVNSYEVDVEEGIHAYTFRKGWAGGMLLFDGTTFTRYPTSGPPPPTLPAYLRSRVFDFFEAKSGALITVSLEGGVPVVRPPCPDLEPCDERAFVFPKPGEGEERIPWDFPLDVARGEDSLTILVTAEEEETYLLHYDAPADAPTVPAVGEIVNHVVEPSPAGTWTFEALPAEIWKPTVLWPDRRGGVFIEAETRDESALWYRNAKGQWFNVALPGKAEDFANRTKPREFLVLVDEADGGHIFATRGPIRPAPNAQEPAATTQEPTTGTVREPSVATPEPPAAKRERPQVPTIPPMPERPEVTPAPLPTPSPAP